MGARSTVLTMSFGVHLTDDLPAVEAHRSGSTRWVSVGGGDARVDIFYESVDQLDALLQTLGNAARYDELLHTPDTGVSD